VGARAWAVWQGHYGSALKGFDDTDPELAKLRETDLDLQLAVDRRSYDKTGQRHFAGWEWGNLNNIRYITSGTLTSDLEIENIWSGEATAAQMAEAWQQVATQGRKEIYEGVGLM
jgi:hypothetical protein